MAEGLRVRAGQTVRADDFVARCYLRGHVDDPDFNNEHIEIVPLEPDELAQLEEDNEPDFGPAKFAPPKFESPSFESPDFGSPDFESPDHE